jgi:peptidase C39-like protein
MGTGTSQLAEGYSRVQQGRAEESASAALATIARHHGLPLSLRDIRSLLGIELHNDVFHLLFASRKCGFDAVPLEGDFEHLPEVPRPNIVTFRRPGDQRVDFMVLYEIDQNSAVIGNTTTGVIQQLSKEEFCSKWNGDAVQILPTQSKFNAIQKQLRDLHDPWATLRRAAGLMPFHAPRIFFVAAAVAVATLIVRGWQDQALLGLIRSAIGFCLMLSVWSWTYTGACKSCGQTAAVVGTLPLAQIGSAYYAVLLILETSLNERALVNLGLLTASGVHLLLLVLLVQTRLFCLPCLLTATAAFLAASLSVAATGIHGWELLAVVGGFLLAFIVTLQARRLHEPELRARAYKLATRVIAEGVSVADGCARLVVYKRKNCPYCSFYETALRPAIEQDFGETVSIDEREAGKETIPTPLFVVSGAANFLLGELPAEAAYPYLKGCIEAALNPNYAGLKTLGGLYVVGFGH